MSEQKKKAAVVVGRKLEEDEEDLSYGEAGTFNVRIPREYRKACVGGACRARLSLGRWLGELARKEASRG